MEKQKSTLINASAFFYGLAVLDIVQLVRALLNGSLKVDAAVTGISEPAAQTVVTVTVIVLLALSSIGMLLKLFLAIKGVRQAQGKGGNGRSHITLAKIMFVLLIIVLIGTISDVSKGAQNWFSLVSPVLSLIAAFFYIKSATALRA